ncbi:MAG: hypothetical protein R2788_08750 [Saprospiraceae bacterium]
MKKRQPLCMAGAIEQFSRSGNLTIGDNAKASVRFQGPATTPTTTVMGRPSPLRTSRLPGSQGNGSDGTTHATTDSFLKTIFDTI